MTTRVHTKGAVAKMAYRRVSCVCRLPILRLLPLVMAAVTTMLLVLLLPWKAATTASSRPVASPSIGPRYGTAAPARFPLRLATQQPVVAAVGVEVATELATETRPDQKAASPHRRRPHCLSHPRHTANHIHHRFPPSTTTRLPSDAPMPFDCLCALLLLLLLLL